MSTPSDKPSTPPGDDHYKEGDVLGPEAGPWAGTPVISVTTRADLLKDGDLVAVPDDVRLRLLTMPAAFSRAAWTQYVTVPPGCEASEKEGLRLWNVLWMFTRAATRKIPSRQDGPSLFFEVHVITSPEDLGLQEPPILTVQAHMGPGDDGTPVLTFMLPDED